MPWYNLDKHITHPIESDGIEVPSRLIKPTLWWRNTLSQAIVKQMVTHLKISTLKSDS